MSKSKNEGFGVLGFVEQAEVTGFTERESSKMGSERKGSVKTSEERDEERTVEWGSRKEAEWSESRVEERKRGKEESGRRR